MAKTKKRGHRKEPSAAVILDGEEFPAAITVELWHRKPKGKRSLIGARRYEIVADLPEPNAVAESGPADVPSAAEEITAAPAAGKRSRQSSPPASQA